MGRPSGHQTACKVPNYPGENVTFVHPPLLHLSPPAPDLSWKLQEGHFANSSYSVVALPSGLLTSSSSFTFPLSPSPSPPSTSSPPPLTTSRSTTTLTVSCTASIGSIFTRTTT